MVEGLLNSAAPLMLAGLGALITDLSGALGIFIEGFMITGAFFSWVFVGWTGSVFWGTFLSATLAALTGWALARFVRLTGANPFIAGLALNLAVTGITLSLSAAWFGTKGVLLNPGIKIPASVPLIANIPLLGKIFSGLNPFTFAAWFCVAIFAIALNRTVPGLRLRASGLSPEAAIERGIRPGLYREGTWAIAAFLAALAGAALTFRVGAYAPGGIAGRGWIALAAVYLGFRKVWGVALAAIVFSFAERLGYGIQSFGALPSTALLGLPFALALFFYFVSQLIKKQ
ncbi:MAG: ABC transporter permease [Treponema sp.]|jgi:simple sugar transport system permease protein|nr:ABC transporter permease [Treponema sp.]